VVGVGVGVDVGVGVLVGVGVGVGVAVGVFVGVAVGVGVGVVVGVPEEKVLLQTGDVVPTLYILKVKEVSLETSIDAKPLAEAIFV
jgi:hypothetical protein